MAASSGQNNETNGIESNDSVVDYEDFCKNFTFSNSTTCYHCNGFCELNFNQPVCMQCHTALFPSIAIRKRPHSMNDVGIHQIPFKSRRFRHDCGVGYLPPRTTAQPSFPSTSRMSRTPLMLRDLNAFFGEGGQNRNNNIRGMIIQTTAVNGKKHINDLPVEILSKIFADLDELSLFTAGKVSKRWKQIVISQQLMWKSITEKRWPLLFRRTETTNWFKMYTALRSSYCCRICFKKMMHVAYNSTRRTMSSRAQKDIERGSEVDGIRITPLNGQLTQLQASIVGPPDTPYEGGIFFLQIHLHPDYPHQTPTFKFLTKVIHPNISRHGDIGLDVLTWNYSRTQSLNKVLLSIQSLLGDPYTRECMEPELGRLYDNDRRRFDALARHWTKKYAMMDKITFDN
ncbi:uncharacterized protein LOC119084271 [Bradysia coprophila]|uniref:uncharacterized protein LOC119084271 n=1 Tax=Bradysia coprophila TaxID=38358 RepID=UPI00187D9E8B|nr:uncharacterized protein LOC119084271 [Bradysia coprophila]XP_037050087.1 uncharacterized protein LOC119084271 [Bradysia coprophila]